MMVQNPPPPSIAYTEQTSQIGDCARCKAALFAYNFFSEWAKCLAKALFMGCVIQSYADFMLNPARCWEQIQDSKAHYFIPVGIVLTSCHIGYRLYWVGRGTSE